MAHTKSGGSTALGRDSAGKRLGVKLYAGQPTKPGSIIIRQRGSKFRAGKNTKLGRDYTIYSMTNGVVKFSKQRIAQKDRVIVNVIPIN